MTVPEGRSSKIKNVPVIVANDKPLTPPRKNGAGRCKRGAYPNPTATPWETMEKQPIATHWENKQNCGLRHKVLKVEEDNKQQNSNYMMPNPSESHVKPVWVVTTLMIAQISPFWSFFGASIRAVISLPSLRND